MNTTLEQIKAHNPCETSYKKLLKGLGKTKADSEPLEFRSIYNILDAPDLIWATRVLDKKTRVHVGALFANTVKHLTKDKRVHNCIEVCFRYARGEATEKELKNAAFDAASAAAAYAANANTVNTAAAAFSAAAKANNTSAATAAAYAATFPAAAYAASDAAIAYADADAAADAASASSIATYKDTKNELALIFLTYIEEI